MQTHPRDLGYRSLSVWALDKVSELDGVDPASVAINVSSRDINSIAAVVAGALVRTNGVAVEVDL
jgi:hypothetical protein